MFTKDKDIIVSVDREWLCAKVRMWWKTAPRRPIIQLGLFPSSDCRVALPGACLPWLKACMQLLSSHPDSMQISKYRMLLSLADYQALGAVIYENSWRILKIIIASSDHLVSCSTERITFSEDYSMSAPTMTPPGRTPCFISHRVSSVNVKRHGDGSFLK